MRGKLLALDKGISRRTIGFSNILYGLTTADDVYLSPFSNYENGFADVFGRPDAGHAPPPSLAAGHGGGRSSTSTTPTAP